MGFVDLVRDVLVDPAAYFRVRPAVGGQYSILVVAILTLRNPHRLDSDQKLLVQFLSTHLAAARFL